MKLNEAYIYWNPGYQCLVLPLPEPYKVWSCDKHFQCVMGGSYADDMTPKERRAECIRLYIQMTLEGVPALQVYEEMYKISDFRQALTERELAYGKPAEVTKLAQEFTALVKEFAA